MYSEENCFEDEPIYTQVVLRSATGASLIKDQVSVEKIDMFKANSSVISKAKDFLTANYFAIVGSSEFALSIAGTKAMYQNLFKTDFTCHIKKISVDNKTEIQEKWVHFIGTPIIPPELNEEIETIYIPPPVRLHNMPNIGYYHLTPTVDPAHASPSIVELTKANAAHSLGYTGNGVTVAMVDTGFVEDHEYYTNINNGYTIGGVHGSDPVHDEDGHGTGMAANLLAVAPGCTFHMFKFQNKKKKNNSAPIAAFQDAKNFPGVKVISCSWGLAQYDKVLATEIMDAVNKGITVVFSVGNHPQTSPDFPAYMREVISVGGVFPTNHGTLEASNFAVSGYNPADITRHCPDVSGICGNLPNGILIIMPTQKNSIEDWAYYTRGDLTGDQDGWWVASGTSAATAQVAGAAAILLSKALAHALTLAPDKIKEFLMKNAIDVKAGTSASQEVANGRGGDPLNPGLSPVGAGLINIEAAVNAIPP